MTNAPPRPWSSLQKAVKKAGLNYTKVGERAGISRQYVSLLANGYRRPSTHIIDLLAAAVGVEASELSVDVALATSPLEMLDEIDGLVNVLHLRLEKAASEFEAIKAKRDELLTQVPA